MNFENFCCEIAGLIPTNLIITFLFWLSKSMYLIDYVQVQKKTRMFENQVAFRNSALG